MEPSSVEASWVARTVRPIIAAGVAGVFLAFMAMAWFGFHSGDAVRALAGTGAGALLAMVPSLLARVEYRITAAGVEKRRVRRDPEEFERLFRWDELSHIVPTRTGFKYYKEVEASNPLTRFIRFHVVSGGSGEVHVEAADRAWVRGALDSRPMLDRGRSE